MTKIKHYKKNTLHFTMSTIGKSNVKNALRLTIFCGEGNALHLTMGYIPIIEFHNPGTPYKQTEKSYTT